MSTGPKNPECVPLGLPTPKSTERRAVSSGVSVFQPLQCMQVCHASSGLVLNASLVDLLEGSSDSSYQLLSSARVFGVDCGFCSVAAQSFT